MASRRIESSNYRNPCITMHQPWASLLVYGIKRIEGRSWPSPIRGRLWIHAAGKVPEPETVKAMEEFYREIYKLNGVTDIKFPEHYPVSRLLGSILDALVRVEGQTAFCWLCEKPQRLIVPFEMRGFQGVYNLEKKIYEAAVRGLSSVKAPQPVTFPLPEPRDRFSLKPGSLASFPSCTSTSAEEKPPSLVAAIAGARAAATQFSKNNIPRAPKTGSIEGNGKPISTRTGDKSKEWLPVQRAGGDTPDSSSSKIGL
ncbi:hypothetical protein SASPL_113477 [Salvia splendens]|uniref:ASCH domain-containing protein n=1 Tax=Salvia splendens TaxID=180675 RepID=A0A8X8Y434_SALSN|nr:hypothetical protein SASPL_113477 [Salvia splendens]